MHSAGGAARRVLDLAQKLLSAVPFILRRLRELAMRDDWIVYGIVGALVGLLLWLAATQWKVRSAEAENLRASLIILGVVALVMVVWQCVRQ
jgi:hypothetical protein